MPDPRFDGSLDAPTFVDRAACAECGQHAEHPNHDRRNERGHFFNDAEPVIRERAMAPAVVQKSLQIIPDHIPPRQSSENNPEKVTISELQSLDLDDEPAATDDDDQSEPVPGPEWNRAIEAIGEVQDRSSCNVTAAALRFAPAAVTVRELSIIARYAAKLFDFKAQLHPSTIGAALLSLRRVGLASNEIRLGGDTRGVQRKLGHWRATKALLNIKDESELPKLNRPTSERMTSAKPRPRLVDTPQQGVYAEVLTQLRDELSEVETRLGYLRAAIATLEALGVK